MPTVHIPVKLVDGKDANLSLEVDGNTGETTAWLTWYVEAHGKTVSVVLKPKKPVESMIIDVYNPLVSSDHDGSCAALCTDDAGEGCAMAHECWCPDGALSYAEFQAKHPDVTVAEA